MARVTRVYEVDPEQFEEMHEVIAGLLDKVFGHDLAEGPNVEFILIDRQRFQSMHFEPLSYSHPKGTDLDAILDVAMANMEMAAEQVHVLMNLRRHQKAVEQERQDMPTIDGRVRFGN